MKAQGRDAFLFEHWRKKDEAYLQWADEIGLKYLSYLLFASEFAQPIERSSMTRGLWGEVEWLGGL